MQASHRRQRTHPCPRIVVGFALVRCDSSLSPWVACALECVEDDHRYGGILHDCSWTPLQSTDNVFTRQQIEGGVALNGQTAQPAGELMDQKAGGDAGGVDCASRRAAA